VNIRQVQPCNPHETTASEFDQESVRVGDIGEWDTRCMFATLHQPPSRRLNLADRVAVPGATSSALATSTYSAIVASSWRHDISHVNIGGTSRHVKMRSSTRCHVQVRPELDEAR
jgi:hypothetical protein